MFALKSMKESKNSELSILRRIFHLCNNPVYETLLNETEAYFISLNKETIIYNWLNGLGVTPPTSYNWELVCNFRAESIQDTNPYADNFYLVVKGFEPKGDLKSYEIELTDREGNVRGRWEDFSDEDFFHFNNKKLN